MSSPTNPKLTETTGLLQTTPENYDASYSSLNTTSDATTSHEQQRKHHKHSHKFQRNQFPEDTFEHAVTDIYESVISDTEHDEDDEDTRWLRQERLNHKLMKWHKRPSLMMISLVMFVYSVGVGISQSAKIQLFLDLACKKVLNDLGVLEGECKKATLQVMVSQLQGLISITGAVVTTLLAGKIGEYSDIYGRKAVILYILIAAVLAKVVTLGLVSPLVSDFHVWSLVGAHMIESFGGGMFVFLAMCNSYITDVVEDHMRIYSIGIVIASLFLGMSIGPVLGSLLVKHTSSNMIAMYADIVITVVAFLIAVFILPESRSQNARRKSRRNSVTLEEQRRIMFTSQKQYYYTKVIDSVNIFKPLKMLWLPAKRPDGTKDFKPRIIVLLIIFIDICLMTCTSCLAQIIILYGTYVFDWNAVHMGYYLAINATTKTLVLIFFSPFFLHQLKKRIKIKTKKIDQLDITCIRFAVFFQTLSALCLTFANNSYVYIGHSFLLCFESIATPTLHSTVIKYSSVESTGAMFGALATVRNLINLVLPATLLYVYSETVSKEPRATFYVQLGFVLLLIVFTLVLGTEQLLKDADVESLESSNESLVSNLRLQKEQRERIHKYMILRRESSSSIASALPHQGSPIKSINHSRKSSINLQPKR